MPNNSAKTPPADLYALYEEAVQAPDAEIAFIDRVYGKLRGRTPTILREDFCGTAWLACEWVKERPTNRAIGLDIDPVPLEYGARTHMAKLTSQQRSRLDIRRQNVLKAVGEKADVIAALNFSYWVFRERASLREYFGCCRKGLARGGLLVLDLMGGSECHLAVSDRTRMRGFTYVWEHASFDPITSETTCKIHFELRSGRIIRNAFIYHWRLWTIPELRELLLEAGFADVRVYWEGTDKRGRGNGVFTERARGTADRSFVAYVVAG